MITYSNTSKVLFSQGKESTINIRAKASQASGDTAFSSVFENTVNNTSRYSRDKKITAKENDVSCDTKSKIRYQSYREVERENSVNTQEKSAAKTVDNASVQDIQDSGAKDSKKYDDTINVLAQMLGIQPNELVKLADELGFSAEDLKNADTLNAFMGKLADVLQLNDSQKALMNILAVEIPKQVSTETGAEAEAKLNSSVADEGVNGLNAGKEESISISEISGDIKARLNQMLRNAEVTHESVSSEISKVVEAMRAQIKTSTEVKTVQTDSESEAVPEASEGSEAEQKTQEIAVNKDNKESAKKDDSKSEENSGKAGNISANVQSNAEEISTQVNTGDDFNQQLNQQNAQAADMKVNMLNNQTPATKAEYSTPQTVRTAEVINQVAEQAKVIIGQDKSEMIIHLKPDHLGKLELKVVTEQGIVAAKFIAESQQVKEIIETNMQLLKDSLEKQGLSIDNVSVQVGQEKQSEYRQQNLFDSSGKNSGNHTSYDRNETGIGKAGYDAFDVLPERLAQYSNETNTINLTA
ncbi:flagellar hook-length control protein FliK [Ruminiclostridium sufflavum DSM 19573]|uniref:Flagellar hook-length control protein FliK n=1 Tax=Ruminiclostridium sufflavum DSM 19573 TaxID=1121337 RepID=A0A318XR67_9FIRM|nr:flagellar hook-length control protein FliK [Ruminiclostridium sufflavum]PYG89823.1 flagellar hook-length control protein FliK [Ruminiclostridium sufflavum DSM 19573]